MAPMTSDVRKWSRDLACCTAVTVWSAAIDFSAKVLEDSMIVDGTDGLMVHFHESLTGTIRPSVPSTSIEYSSSAAVESMEAPYTATVVQ